MTRNNYKLTIKDPCGQRWNSMTKNDVGKYCSNCAKTVIDLTILSDNEIIQIIENSKGKLCGRLTNKQLNRPLYSAKPQINSKKLYRVLAGLIFVGTSNKVTAEIKPQSIATINYLESKNYTISNNISTVIKDSTNSIKGKITDKDTNEPIAYASVLIKGTKIGAISNDSGNFQLDIPESLKKEKITLVVNFISYQNTEVTINPNEISIFKQIFLVALTPTLVGEIEIVVKKKWWQRKK